VQRCLVPFAPDISKAIDEVERQIHSSATPLDFKTSMDLLRSVFEKIVQESARRIANHRGDTAPVGNFNPCKQYLQSASLLGSDEAEVVQKLYNYVSNAGAHSLASAPEQVRVTKNTVIEWALLLLGRVQALVM
jgi:hypothetical protein